MFLVDFSWNSVKTFHIVYTRIVVQYVQSMHRSWSRWVTDGLPCLDVHTLHHFYLKQTVVGHPLNTGRMQFKVLTTLPLKSQAFMPTIEYLYRTIKKDINFVLFRKFCNWFSPKT